eukprot:11351676-Heterocapsa_arctica.AAC.1
MERRAREPGDTPMDFHHFPSMSGRWISKIRPTIHPVCYASLNFPEYITCVPGVMGSGMYHNI